MANLAPVSLTSTSYLVLGLVGGLGPCTSYDMKRAVAESVGYFWTFPHSQLYAEPARLAAAGLLHEEQEEVGRRRRTYRLTDRGREALRAWLADPRAEPTEIRDLPLLKVFFGRLARPEEIQAIARDAARRHREQLAEYDAIRQRMPAMDAFARATLELGLRYERIAVEFWQELADNDVAPD